MTSNEGPGPRILGSLRSAAGAGVVRIEDRYDTGVDDLWSALTEISATTRVSMIAKDLIPEMGTRSFAIMNGGRKARKACFQGRV